MPSPIILAGPSTGRTGCRLPAATEQRDPAHVHRAQCDRGLGRCWAAHAADPAGRSAERAGAIMLRVRSSGPTTLARHGPAGSVFRMERQVREAKVRDAPRGLLIGLVLALALADLSCSPSRMPDRQLLAALALKNDGTLSTVTPDGTVGVAARRQGVLVALEASQAPSRPGGAVPDVGSVLVVESGTSQGMSAWQAIAYARGPNGEAVEWMTVSSESGRLRAGGSDAARGSGLPPFPVESLPLTMTVWAEYEGPGGRFGTPSACLVLR